MERVPLTVKKDLHSSLPCGGKKKKSISGVSARNHGLSSRLFIGRRSSARGGFEAPADPDSPAEKKRSPQRRVFTVCQPLSILHLARSQTKRRRADVVSNRSVAPSLVSGSRQALIVCFRSELISSASTASAARPQSYAPVSAVPVSGLASLR
ncbi:hypothetical protein VTN02DRAFT_1040 [Thermoascus thermophilus]